MLFFLSSRRRPELDLAVRAADAFSFVAFTFLSAAALHNRITGQVTFLSLSFFFFGILILVSNARMKDSLQIRRLSVGFLVYLFALVSSPSTDRHRKALVVRSRDYLFGESR